MVIIFFIFSHTCFAEESSLKNNKTVYSFGVVPQFDTRRSYAIWRPILNELEKRTGFQFTLRGSINIPQFEVEFKAGKFDFAYMNPYHVMLAQKGQGYIPLVRDVAHSLHGIIVVKKNSPIKSLSELANKTIAFPAPSALGATLLVRSELEDKHHLKITPHYAQTHSSVYLNVALGEAIAGGGVQKTFSQQPAEVKQALRIICRTKEVPSHPITAHPRVKTSVRQKVRKALLEMSKTTEGKKLLNNIPVKQLGPASVSDYEPLAKMKLERFY